MENDELDTSQSSIYRNVTNATQKSEGTEKETKDAFPKLSNVLRHWKKSIEKKRKYCWTAMLYLISYLAVNVR